MKKTNNVKKEKSKKKWKPSEKNALTATLASTGLVILLVTQYNLYSLLTNIWSIIGIFFFWLMGIGIISLILNIGSGASKLADKEKNIGEHEN